MLLAHGSLAGEPGEAGDTIDIGDAATAHGGRAWVLEDRDDTLKRLEDVRDGPAAAGFRPLAKEGENRGFTSSVYWLRLRLKNAGRASSFILALGTIPEIAELHEDAPGARPRSSGSAFALQEREVRHPNIAFRLEIPPGERRLVWVRIRSHDTMMLDPRIWTETAFWESAARIQMRDGCYYGLMMGLIAYNLFLFLFTGSRSYAWYVVFQSMTGLVLAALDKYAFVFLWPSHPGWAARSEQIFGGLAVAFWIGFAREFLGTRKAEPRFDRALVVCMVAMLASTALGLWRENLPPKAVNSVQYLITVSICGAVVVRAAWHKGQVNARIFLVACAVMIVTALLAVLGTLGAFGAFDRFVAVKLGSAFEAVLLSVALASRINALRRERQQAQRELLAAKSARVEALARLVSGVAHEVGNPLNFARGGADELGERLDALAAGEPELAGRLEPARRAQRLVRSGLDRIKTILDNLRTYVRSRDVAEVPTDLGEEIDRALELARGRLERGGVRVEKEVAALPSISTRPGEMHQVLVNLITNALHAMPDGGTLRVGAGVKDGLIEVSVEDTGPGIEPANRELIFEPFFTTRASSDGSGLGLAVTREIVLRHGGQIRVEDRGTDPGARFVVSLPHAR